MYVFKRKRRPCLKLTNRIVVEIDRTHSRYDVFGQTLVRSTAPTIPGVLRVHSTCARNGNKSEAEVPAAENLAYRQEMPAPINCLMLTPAKALTPRRCGGPKWTGALFNRVLPVLNGLLNILLVSSKT